MYQYLNGPVNLSRALLQHSGVLSICRETPVKNTYPVILRIIELIGEKRSITESLIIICIHIGISKQYFVIIRRSQKPNKQRSRHLYYAFIFMT